MVGGRQCSSINDWGLSGVIYLSRCAINRNTNFKFTISSVILSVFKGVKRTH